MADDVPPSSTPRKLLSLPQAAAHLCVSQRSLMSRQWRQAQGIPCFKLSSRMLRFDAEELDQWIAARRAAGSAA